MDGFAAVSLADPGDPWNAMTVLPTLSTQPDGFTYELYGGSSNNSWSSSHVSFTLETLQKLEPGEVLTQGYELDNYVGEDVVVDRETFETKSCP